MGTSRARNLFSILFLLTLLPLSALWAGSIDASFEAKLEAVESNEMVSAMVMMSEEVDLISLDSDLILEKASRQERHERVVRALQEKARVTQKDVRRLLESALASGEVEEFEPFWVANVIAVTATRDFIYGLSQRLDVGVVYEDMVIPLDDTYRIRETSGDPLPLTLGIEHGVRSLNADSLWRMGITGEGTLVCNLDTGVDGSHPSFADRWRGNLPDVDPEDAWYDPYGHTTFPVDDDGHGTGTMGCITGADHATGDSIGVAPDAMWIAANVFETGVSNSSAFTGAFQWTIDPDGDPATIDDVPDVVSNSWGSSSSCGTGYWASIDANIAAGVAVLFSAGNEGPAPQTTGSPADRITSPTNAFAVGATDPNNNIAGFSSRGPSVCDGETMKPEVVAHGTNVRTARRGGGYSFGVAGTSFSCPYVAGGVALLRQVSSSATPDQLMEALMSTAVDLGDPGEDNAYGHGIPDLVAAAEEVALIERSPRLVFSGSVVDDGNDGIPEAGESFDLIVYLGNLSSQTTGVEATLSLVEPDPMVTIGNDAAIFGDVGRDETVGNAATPYEITLSEETPGAHVMAFVLDITSDGGTYTVQLNFSLRTPFVITMADHDVGNVRFSVSDGGKFGWEQNQASGSGFVYPVDTSQDNLFEGALLAGYDSVHVSHCARNDPAGNELMDWQLVPGGDIEITTPGTFSDQDGFSMYSDAGADNPMDVEVTQKSYAWSDSTSDDFVIVELTFKNMGIDSSSDIENFYAGVYTDWDIQPFFGTPRNNAAVDTAWDVGFMYNQSNNRHCAVHVLTEPGLAGFDIMDNQNSSYGFTKPEYWASMSSGIVDWSGSMQDYSCIIATGPFDIPAGDSVTVAFAFVGGDSLEHMYDNITAARIKYEVPVGTGDGAKGDGNLLPRAFGMAQNYPNPFNPSTTIQYRIPASVGEAVHVTLDVFDMRGRKVRTLVDADKAAGDYSIRWDGRGDRGEELASGIYLYRIKAGDFEETRRMLMLK